VRLDPRPPPRPTDARYGSIAAPRVRMAPDAAMDVPRANAAGVSQIETGVTTGLIFAAQPAARLAVWSREVQEILRGEVAADAETAQRRCEIERRAPHALPEQARRSQTVRRRCLLKRGVEVLPDQSRRPGGHGRADFRGLEKDDLDACRRKRCGARATRQAAANDDN
jgi:hypothetical protein